jgi:Na+/proline symporter
VLLTDTLQFIVLQLAVLFVIPLLALALASAPALQPVPPTFFSPVSDQYGLLFLVGWVAIHFFVIGAEWAFAQRYICVPSDRDAQKSAYLFGVLYLVSPALWLAPAIMYRMLDPNANPEQAYILASKAVLPSGMLGLMVAAMFSATASTVSGQINVFAGVLTEQFYHRARGAAAGAAELVTAGRLFTLAIGVALVGVALIVPQMGGAEGIIIAVTGLLFGPLMAPTVWGLWSGRIGLGAVLATAGISLAVGLVVKLGMAAGASMGTSEMAAWTRANPRMTDIILGAVLPVVILTAAHLLSRRPASGWAKVQARFAAYTPTSLEAGGADHSSGGTVALGLGASGVLMLFLLIFNTEGRAALASFGLLLIALAFLVRRYTADPTPAA